MSEQVEAPVTDAEVACICPEDCDCQLPPTHMSEHCPDHNLFPWPVGECRAETHAGGQQWRTKMRRVGSETIREGE